MSEAKPKNIRWWIWLMVPLGLGLGIWLGLGWWKAEQRSPQELFLQYFQPHHLPVLYTDGGNVANWTEAAQKYQAGDFEEARLALLRAEMAREFPPSATQFYIGQCYLATGRPDEAIEAFRGLMQLQEAPHAAVRWYLALALLQTGDLAGAKDLLWEIEGDKGYKAGTASQLLDEL
jgi:predicted Zn-dependent protease